MKALLFTATVLALALPTAAATSPEGSASIRMDYSNPGLSPSSWTLTLRSDGSGHFTSRPGKPEKDLMGVPAMDEPIQVSPDFAQRAIEAASSKKVLFDECESHLKVAFRGWKTITYTDGDKEGSCKFNYSKDKEIQGLSESLLAVATTVVEGRRLEMLLLHDPLGLDHEMGFLVEALGDGRVQQIGAIRGILERLEDDQSVMERVRKRAHLLLAKADNGN